MSSFLVNDCDLLEFYNHKIDDNVKIFSEAESPPLKLDDISPSPKRKKTHVNKEDKRYRLLRERNNASAVRSRQRRRDREQNSVEKVNRLETENVSLKSENDKLNSEVKYLRNLLMQFTKELNPLDTK